MSLFTVPSISALLTKRTVIDSDSIPASLIIHSIQRYSYGQFDDGSIAFWVPSRAGWFEISPSRRYRAIFRDMVDAINILYFVSDSFQEMTRKQMRQTSPETVFERYADEAPHRCKNGQTARLLFVRHKDALLKLMRQGKEGINWKTTEIFRFLDNDPQEVSFRSYPDSTVALTEVQVSSELEDAAVSTPNVLATESLSSDEDTSAHLARKGKSVLRPKVASESSKGAARQQALLEIDGDIEMEDAANFVQSSPSRRKSEDDASPRPVKRRRGRPPRNRPPEEQPQATSEKAETLPDQVSLPLPSQSKPAQKAPLSKPPSQSVTLIETPLPTFEANQAGDVWACGFDGCAHRVFAASTDQSKSLIEEHYRHHAQDSQAQIDLICKEERPYLPVGHLIKRIRDMTAQQKTLNHGQTATKADPPWKRELMAMPSMIQRKY